MPAPICSEYRVAKNREVFSWSYGALVAVRTAGASWEQQRGTLDDQAIFGPKQDFLCVCGKYSGRRYQGLICDRCGVKITSREERQRRFGHIELPEEIQHPCGTPTGQLGTVPVLPGAFVESSRGDRLGRLYEELVRAVESSLQPSISSAVEGLFRLVGFMLMAAHDSNSPTIHTLARGLALQRKVLPDGRCDECGYPLAGLNVRACPGCGRTLPRD